MQQLHKILFLTPTIGTRWITYQQYLLHYHFPKSKTKLINGTERWNFKLQENCVWFDFIKLAIKDENSFDYFVHIDEDCFLLDSDIIEYCINLINKKGIDLIGPKDIIENFRDGDPSSLNSFFMIGKISTLKDVWSQFDFELKKNHTISSENTNIKHQEPYYVFFWNYYVKNYKIDFLDTNFDSRFNCTAITKNNTTYALHMWFTREWFKNFDLYGMPNNKRYFLVEEYLKTKFNINRLKLKLEYLKPVLIKIKLKGFTGRLLTFIFRYKNE